MNVWIIVILGIAAQFVGTEAQCAVSKDPRGCYSTRFDRVNIDQILKNDRLLKRYVDCLMDRATCTSDGRFLKDIIPDVLKTECAKCSDQQKKQAGKILGFMLQNKREWFNEILGKYDKVGLYRKKYSIDENNNDYKV